MRSRTPLLGLLLLIPCGSAVAHPLAPSLLEIRETEPGRATVLFRTPIAQTAGSTLYPDLPPTCTADEEPVATRQGTGVDLRWSIGCTENSLVAKSFGVRGLEGSRTSTLLRILLANGQQHHRLLNASNPSFTVPTEARRGEVLRQYTLLGIEHILSGPDHLLFVLALLLLIRGRKLLLWTISAFTLGHSVTLALAVLEVIYVPQAPVEVLIAASILFLAVELVRPPDAPASLTQRYPWAIAAGFGLLHGLGFAGALAEIGVPQGEIPLALLSFNIGIEAGQLGFIALCLALAGVSTRFAKKFRPKTLAPPASGRVFAAYAIGSLAAFWLFERLATIAGSST